MNRRHLVIVMDSFDILLFSAHPDDVDFAMGGTFLKLARTHRVAHVILTRGEAGTYGNPQVREEEARCSAQFAGATLEFLDFKDNHVEDTAETAKILAGVIRKYCPKLIFAPYHTNNGTHVDGRAHPDHSALGRAVLKAARFAKFKNAPIQGEKHAADRIIYYMVPVYMKPSFVVDVSDIMPDLNELWKCYGTQLSIRDGKIVDVLTTERKWLGAQNGCEYAEGFLVDTPLKVDCSWMPKL
jgi:N-acetylglucosamine malate deacetylase 1